MDNQNEQASVWKVEYNVENVRFGGHNRKAEYLSIVERLGGVGPRHAYTLCRQSTHMCSKPLRKQTVSLAFLYDNLMTGVRKSCCTYRVLVRLPDVLCTVLISLSLKGCVCHNALNQFQGWNVCHTRKDLVVIITEC